MADWIELKKKHYLTVEDMAALNNNFNYLRDYYLSFNLPVGELIDVAVEYSISPAAIQQKFNDVEQNIQTIQKTASDHLLIESKYFKKHTWEKYPRNLKKEVWRWIDWFNEIKQYKIGYTDLIDMNGETIADINGETLQVLESYKEEN